MTLRTSATAATQQTQTKGRSTIEQAVGMLDGLIKRPKVTTGLMRPTDTLMKASLDRTTVPPSIVVRHDGRFDDVAVRQAVKGFLAQNGMGFDVTVTRAAVGKRQDTSQIEKAVEALAAFAIPQDPTRIDTGLLQPRDTLRSAQLDRSTVPPHIVISHSGQYSDDRVLASVRDFMLKRGWGFEVEIS